MQHLQKGTLLQHGKYRIERVLGQGGFGITYLAENTMLEGKVAIKEFFFKEYCERGETTSCVTVPTSANREIVERFKQKFIKEARTIFRLSHPNIVRILDVFEENDTAYYVMEHIDGESLGDLVKRRGALPEQEALGYIRQAADALSYIHGERMNHLDVKPGNLMRRAKDGRVLLIDFGVAKQYDVLTSEGTTTTPVGISHGYSPAEQYRKNGVQNFSPSSDVYALAATLFKLLTGNTPPEAMEVNDDGLPLDELRAKGVSESVISAIVMAMKGRNERTQSAAEFVENLANTEECTIPVIEAPLIDLEETISLISSGKSEESQIDVPSDSQVPESKVSKGPRPVVSKVIMPVSGLALILFLTFHACMNVVAIFSLEWYNMIIEMFSTEFAIVATGCLAALVLVHFINAFILTFQKRKSDAPASVEWASQNMLILGITVILGMLLHLYNFWYNMMFQELIGGDTIDATDGVYWINETFGNGLIGYVYTAVYLVWLCALWFHLSHGFWSAFQTMGLSGKTWFPRLKCIGQVYTTVIVLMFVAVAVWYCIIGHFFPFY